MTSPSQILSLEFSKLAVSSFMCNENAATCEEDGQKEEAQESLDNDDEDSETNQWETFSASVFTSVNDLLCGGTKATTMMMLTSVW